MKKAITAITALLYLLLTTGVSVNVHYCMGKVDSVSFSVKAGKICDRCGMHSEKAGGCCSDAIHFYKVDDSQQAGGHQYVFSAAFAELPPRPFQNPLPDMAQRDVDGLFFSDASPPPLYRDRLAFNCTFRI